MSVTSGEGLFVALAFIVPGFVISSVRARFVTGRIQKGSDQVIHYLTLSALNYAVFSWLIYLLIVEEYSAPVSAALWLTVILAGPAVFGIVLGYEAQRGWSRRILHRVHLRPVHVLPTAWDWQFSRLADEHWIMVTLKDGTRAAGLFGGGSFASSDPSERDLYIEQLYNIGDDDTWERGPEGKGMLFRPEDIRFVEFWPAPGDQGDDNGR